MDFRFIFDQFTSAIGGFALGILSGLWLHAVWIRSHPQKLRFWGAWYSDPRVLVLVGIGLAAGWTTFLLKSFW